MRGALKDVPGVARVDIEQGQETFTVHYDSAKTTPQKLLAAVQSGGEPQTKLKS